MMPGNGQLTVPPGFRFHPTDEELLYYYLRKKVSYEAIDLDVIREVDLNKLEPWDLKEKCRIGSGPQNEWYFFSHKDKKYPTGTRTNRATTAGFWKATGRDKAIHLSNSKRIGMRKTLVFYTGRAPHGQKTDWIMHEYRLDDDNHHAEIHQEDGWVVCRVFKKKNQMINRGFQPEINGHDQEEHDYITSSTNMKLFSPETSAPPSLISPLSLNNMDVIECSQNLLRLTSTSATTTTTGTGSTCGGLGGLQAVHQQERFNGGDWSFLDKLLASHHSHLQQQDHQQQQQHPPPPNKCTNPSSSNDHVLATTSTSSHRSTFPFQYLGCCDAADILKFSK